RYLGYQRQPRDRFFLEVNAHPPTSVLLAVPLARLDYPDAFLVWSLSSLAALAASVWLVVRHLRIPFSVWALAPALTLLLACNPFRQQMNQGQLNLVLLLLLTGVWVADRSARPGWAGALLGAATAIKLFPAFLFLYFLLRRQRRVVAAGVLSFAVLTGLTAALLGPATYRCYVEEVLPQVAQFRDWWP